MSILLDTHIWLWWSTGAVRLTAAYFQALDKLASRDALCISAMSLWEVQMLVKKGRLVPNEPFDRWLRKICAPGLVQILPLDPEIVIALHGLPDGFHGDPADRLIVATARANGLPLATYDRNIRTSRLVKLWKP